MAYIDGFLIAVPAKNREVYLELAKAVAPVFKKHGALQVVECWGDDVPEGKVTSFPMAVKKADDEVVVFSWIVWPSKAVRDEGNRKFMEDPVMQQLEGSTPPFDGKRMIFGGFEVILDA